MIGQRAAPFIVAALAALLTACAPRIAAPPAVERIAPDGYPGNYYQRLRADGKPVFSVDPVRSLVVMEIRRGGTFAQFGHDHVVASHDVNGYVAPDEGRADLYIRLDELVVDEPDLRANAGLGPPPDPSDIEGTRHNLLAKVLDTGRFPYALITVNNVAASDGAKELKVAMTLHGITRHVGATTIVDRTAAEITVTGTIAIDQSDFGIAPLSILGGAISVQDRVNMTFRIRAFPVN